MTASAFVRDVEARNAVYELASRTIDLVVAVLALIVSAPLLLAIAVVIRLTSEGPAIFRQERIGRGGRPFVAYKFRTMRVGESDHRHREYVASLITQDVAENDPTDGERVYKLVGDDRVTSIGRWLRRTSLDELPQLLNVVNGSMSLVGPRPGLQYEVDLYGDLERRRLAVTPGMTGLWQVSGRNRLSMREMFELDARYVEEQSVWLDLRILAKTPRELIKPSGAQ